MHPPDDPNAFDRLARLVALLRGPGGCPWDRAQSLESMKPHLIEEAHEAADAIDRGDLADLTEELGDLLFLVLFLGHLTGEKTGLRGEDLARGVTAKMISRHPHVFEDAEATTPGDVLVHWEKSKSRERRDAGRSVLDGLPLTLPALQRAHRLQERAAGLGFDWPAAAPVMEKLREELGELEAEVAAGDGERVRDEIGDLIFSVVNLARKLGVNAEDALRGTSEKFRSRFARVEDGIRASAHPLTLEEMDALWDQAKAEESSRRK